MRHYSKRKRAETEHDCESVEARDDMREPGRLLLEISGYSFDVELRPHHRDVRLWHAYRDGKPWIPAAGLERIWRAIQSEIAPPLGRRHWG